MADSWARLVEAIPIQRSGRIGRPTVSTDPAAARKQVDDDQSRGGDHHPGRLHREHHPGSRASTGEAVRRWLPDGGVYQPHPPDQRRAWSRRSWTSSSARWRSGASAARWRSPSCIAQRPDPAQQDAGASRRRRWAQRQATAGQTSTPSRSSNAHPAARRSSFNPLAYMAPGMALMFLMYTVSNGGRTPADRAHPGHPAAPAGLTDQPRAGAGRQDDRHLS